MDSSSFSNPSSCESTSIASTKYQYKKKNNKTKGGSAVRSKLSTDPQSVAARQRRHRISDRFKILQSLVPGGSKMDTVSMLEEAIQYVKFLKSQIWLHQAMIDLVDHHDPTLFSDQLNSNSYSAVVPSYFQQDQMADMYCSNYSGNQQGLQEYYYSWLQGDENGCFHAPF